MEPGPSSVPTVLFRASLPLPDKRTLKAFAAELAARVADGREFTCIVTKDKQLHKLNKEFLGHDYPTDVLSFPSGEAGNLGDLAISAERAAEQAAEFGHTLLDEIKILMLHGLLHLRGYDHEADTGEMKRAERKWQKELGLPVALIARAGRRQ